MSRNCIGIVWHKEGVGSGDTISFFLSGYLVEAPGLQLPDKNSSFWLLAGHQCLEVTLTIPQLMNPMEKLLLINALLGYLYVFRPSLLCMMYITVDPNTVLESRLSL